MLDSRFWDGAEWVCKTARDSCLSARDTARSVAREFRVAWVSGVEAARAADALADREAETEVWPGSADFDDEPLDMHPDAVYGREYVRQAKARAAQHRYALRTDSVAECLKDAYCAIKAENPNAIVTTAPAASAVVEDLPDAGTPLLASGTDSIRDVLAEHYLETYTDRRIVGCRCGLELGSRQQHWDHQADLIAGALKARAEAAEK